ncbi:uncharacterized protein LOC113782531 [Coffea eugenioides]|uniref:uncharacterized protein LOC113782531 n=1 Tax=Coffea eugenioides TaxID=49369 RepID=UPI000F605B52|nr:uncharacterized protein LOC113782531 [Coffea eugenioides]
MTVAVDIDVENRLDLFMPRSSHTGELIFDPEVEKTARRTRKETRQIREELSSVASQGFDLEVELMNLRGDNSSDSDQEKVTMVNAQTLRELAAHNLNQQPLCIIFPSLNDNTPFELKFGLIHLLPSFHGLPGEEPYKHLQKFDVVCNSMKPPKITEEQIKMRAFPFSLKDSAKDWLYYLSPASQAASLRKEICGIKQHPYESLYEYCKRFKKLCIKCPQHQISEQLLIQYFYEGLLFRNRSIVDAASGETLVNKTPRVAWELIEGMVENSQQFGSREDISTRKVNEVKTSSIQQQLSELTSFMRQLVMGSASQAKVCGVCTVVGHYTKMCPLVQEETAEQETNSDLQSMRNQLGQVQSLQTQVNQMTIMINRLESQIQGKLPSQTELNSKNVSAMTLRSDKKVREPEPVIPKDKDEERIEKELEEKGKDNKDQKVLSDLITRVKTNPPPFSSRLKKPKKQDREKEVLEIFRKVEINIPLLNAIK